MVKSADCLKKYGDPAKQKAMVLWDVPTLLKLESSRNGSTATGIWSNPLRRSSKTSLIVGWWGNSRRGMVVSISARSAGAHRRLCTRGGLPSTSTQRGTGLAKRPPCQKNWLLASLMQASTGAALGQSPTACTSNSNRSKGKS